MFPQENQPGNLVNVLQLGCPGDRHCSSGVRYSLSTHRLPETPTDSHTQAGAPVQAAAAGGMEAAGEGPICRGSPALDETHRARPAKRALTMGEPPCLGVIRSLVPWTPVEA